MSIELRRNKNDTFALSNTAWAFWLTLAERYGWRPAGTVAPRRLFGARSWAGAYDSSDGQLVTHEDAVGFASALERAAADVAHREQEVQVAKELSLALEKVVGFPCPVSPPDDGDATMRALAVFCSKGKFRIA